MKKKNISLSRAAKQIRKRKSPIMIMVGYYPDSCDTTIPVHACDPCEPREFGRLRSFGFIHKDYAFLDDDASNPAGWVTGINNKSILVVPESHGEMPEPSPKTGPGYGDAVETLLGYDFSAKVFDPNFASNCDFYNALIGNRNFKFFFRTSSKTYITPVPVTIIPGFNVPDDTNAEVVWSVQMKWTSDQFPCPFNTPEGIFKCYYPE